MPDDKLPPIVEAFSREKPKVWDAYNELGRAIAEAGPLDDKTQRLIKLALAVGAGLQGAVHSHTRRGLAAGLTAEQIRHVALLGVTTVGWPTAFSGLSWISEEIEKAPD